MASRGERFSGSCGVVGGDLLGHPVVRGDQLRIESGGVADHDEEGAGAGLAQVQRGLEEAEGQVGWRGSPHGLAPGGELAGDVEQPPPRVAEAEDHRPAGEDLDLLAGSQHQADVAAAGASPWRGSGRGAGRGVPAARGPWTWSAQRCDVDHPEQVALAIDQEDRLDAVAEPVEPLDRRQPGVEPRRPLGVDPIGVGRVVIACPAGGPRSRRRRFS